MSTGDLKTNGLKGNNHPFQHRMLLALGDIIQNTQGLVPPGGGLATEATLLDVLAAVDSMRDYEVRLVVDSDTPNVTWLEVRYWDAQDGTLGAPVYYPPGSTTPGAPVLPITYINPNTLLTQLLSELMAQTALLTTIDADTSNLDVALSTRASEATLQNIETLLTTIDGVLDSIKLDTANLDVALSTRATEATLLLVRSELTTLNTTASNLALDATLVATNALLTTIDSVLDAIKVDTGVLATPVGGLATSLINAAGAAGSVAAGKRRVSFFNSGNTDTTVAGGTLGRGLAVTFSADGLRDTLAAIPYDPQASSLLITTVG